MASDDTAPGMKNDGVGSGGARREPPTIDLAADEFSADRAQTPPRAGRFAQALRMARSSASTIAIAAVTAVLTAGVMMALRSAPPAIPVSPNPSAALLADLSARLQRLERQPAPVLTSPAGASADPELVARVSANEQAALALREQNAAARRQLDALASALNELKTTPPAAAGVSSDAPGSADIAAIGERLAGFDRTLRALKTQLDQPQPALADERTLRRAIVAAALDQAVRDGGPYDTALAAARQLNPAEMLAPLESFAASGLPSDAALCAAILALVPAWAPSASQTSAGPWWERMQARAAGLVRIHPVGETAGDDVPAIVTRIDAAARRNDASAALQAIATLPSDHRASAEKVVAQAAARNAARAAARRYLADAIAALAKPTP